MELITANEDKVKRLVDHLVKAFEDYCNSQPEEVEYVDAFMAAHNFHCIIVLDIERRKRLSPRQQVFWRKMAIDTFTRAMENKPAWNQDND